MGRYGHLGHNQYYQLGTSTVYYQGIKRIENVDNIKFKTTDATSYSSVALDEEGNIWTWGWNNYGCLLGNGDNNKNIEKQFAEKINTSVKFKAVSAGNLHCMALDEQGHIWTWGCNQYGQLGDESIEDNSSLKKIIENTRFKEISTNNDFCMALDEEGNIWTWGCNDYGQLGDETTENNATPKKINCNTKFQKISAGNQYSTALDIDGNIWTWGRDINGELGDGNKTTRSIPQKINTSVKFKDLSTGANHSMALDEQSNLWTWGNNSWGQLRKRRRYSYTNESFIKKCLYYYNK